MPTKPTIQKLNATAPDILNTLRNEAGGQYKDIIPIADGGDLGTLRSIGEVVMTYEPLQNAYLSALVNRIGRVLITSRLYSNPWAGFKKGLLEYGETVEEIFVELAKPHQFDPELAETNQFKREIPDVKAAFHTMNYQKFYKTTVSNDQLRQAFLSWQGITDLIGKIIDALYTGANYDEFLTMKYLISRIAIDGQISTVQIPAVNADNAKSIVSTIKGISNSLEFISTEYNMAGVHTYTDKRFQYLIMSAKFNAVIDVEVLASAFNMSKAEFMGNVIMVDSFAPTADEQKRLALLFADDPNYTPFTQAELDLLNSLPCVLVDEQWFMIFDNYYNMTEKYNGEGLYWNYWYHVWKTFSVSPFNNAILFSSSDTPSAITQVTVTPTTATVTAGNKITLTANVTSTGFVNKDVKWAIIGDSKSSITQEGVLTVFKDHPAGSIDVVATPVADTAKATKVSITVVAG